MVILLSIGETAEKTISEGERYIESISPAAGSRPQIARAPLKGKDPRDAIVDHCKDGVYFQSCFFLCRLPLNLVFDVA